jgi:hypothetical protein
MTKGIVKDSSEVQLKSKEQNPGNMVYDERMEKSQIN